MRSGFVKIEMKINSKIVASYLFIKNKLIEFEGENGSNKVKTKIVKTSKKPLTEIPNLRTYFLNKKGSLKPAQEYTSFKILNLYF